MNKQEELNLTLAKIDGICQRCAALDREKNDLTQEALRLDGEVRLLKRQIENEKPKPQNKKGGKT